MLLTSNAAESIHQKLLVVVLLTDYHITTCNKGCRWQVSNNNENHMAIYLFMLFSLLVSIELIC